MHNPSQHQSIPTNKPLWMAFSRMKHPSFAQSEHTFIRGKGAYLWDSTGKKYFDGFSTLWTNLVGHGREDIIEAMTNQMRELSFMHLFSGSQHRPAQELSARLIEASPFNHKHCFFGLSGSDATETAMKMARLYWYSQGKTKKNHIIGRLSEYHGTSYGALSLMGWDSYQEPYAPLVGNIHRIAPPNCYHCPWALNPSSCKVQCKNSFRDYFEKIDARTNVAAILIEPVITSDGLITPPEDYWKEIQQACLDHDVLVITDEVSTGMGRTGSFYAATDFGLKPDITFLAKSLTSGYAPLSATLSSSKIFETIHENEGKSFFTHGTTFGGHPLGCTAAIKVLEILSSEALIERAKTLEKCLFEGLTKHLMTDELPIVGNIRGKGLLFEVELVKDRESKEAPQDEVSLAMHIYQEALNQGQYLRPLGRFICIAPPLISTETEIEELCLALKRTLLKIKEIKSLW